MHHATLDCPCCGEQEIQGTEVVWKTFLPMLEVCHFLHCVWEQIGYLQMKPLNGSFLPEMLKGGHENDFTPKLLWRGSV